MFKPKLNVTNILTLIVAVGVVGGLIYINSSTYFTTSTGSDGAPTVQQPVSGNPLLTAKKEDVSRWFPGTCFAEIYMQSSSYGGALVQGCIEKTIREVASETGYKLSPDDFRKPEVIAHFKTVYGAAPWRT